MLLGDVFTFVMDRVDHYIARVGERLEIMRIAKEKRTAPTRYLRMLHDISPQHPNDWRADDVCFLEQYQKDQKLHQKLLQIRKNYFNDRV